MDDPVPPWRQPIRYDHQTDIEETSHAVGDPGDGHESTKGSRGMKDDEETPLPPIRPPGVPLHLKHRGRPEIPTENVAGDDDEEDIEAETSADNENFEEFSEEE
jgi:hypothetical protein